MRFLVALLLGVSCMSLMAIAQEEVPEQTEGLTPQQQRLADLIAAQRAQGGTTAKEIAAARAETAQERAQTAATEKVVEALRKVARSDVAKALEQVPASLPYVDLQNGDFDYAAARADMRGLEAKRLEREWNLALSEVRANS